MVVTRDASKGATAIDVFRGPVGANAELLCDPSDVAVFWRDGRVVGALGPGRTALVPSSAPFLHMALAPDGSLAATIYFLRTTPIAGIRFGGPVGSGASGGNVFGEASATIRDPLRLVQALSAAPQADASNTFASYVAYAILEAARAIATTSDTNALTRDSGEAKARIQNVAGQRLREMGIELGGIESFTLASNEPAVPRVDALTDVAYEMLWDCKFCGAKKLLGLKHRHCPSCGAPQSAEDRYFPSDADKVRAEDHVYVGADVRCTHCGEANSRNAKCCGGCGAPLDGGKDVARRHDQVVNEGAIFEGQTKEAARREREANEAPTGTPKKTNAIRLVAGVGCLSILALVALAVVAFMWKKESTLVVSGHSWRREIAIERFGPTADSSWCESVPLGARGVSRSREVRSQRRIPDGQDCRTRKVDRGNGTFVEKQECSTRYREEPVYDDRCHYTIDRWAVERTLSASGASTEGVRWPDLGPLPTGTCLGCERPGSRKESYTVELTDSHATKQTCDVDVAKWTGFRDGSRWKGGIRVIGGGLDCSTLTPN
jgi:hypothetical protein